ncbi:hypothetical protein OH76DRAFT_1400503 [Lentinus brumalis]|uniref:Uncharacterized protein n=1 Tax=Lentinus brumalis TaxID=2498619 RepID=A0A371DI03_9APHY|nr:hypothetical protein OH76DRAFT_1400503 [Polyporus brumalis]
MLEAQRGGCCVASVVPRAGWHTRSSHPSATGKWIWTVDKRDSEVLRDRLARKFAVRTSA